MNVLAIVGSPVKNGITENLVDQLTKGIASANDKVEINKLFLQEQEIKPCFACQTCQKLFNDKCVIDDDMADNYPKILAADILIFATPIYWWNVSAQTKLFIDRMYALLHKDDVSNFAGKKVILINCYGGERPNSGPKIVDRMFQDMCQYLKVDLVATVGVYTGKNSEEEIKEAGEHLFDMGAKL